MRERPRFPLNKLMSRLPSVYNKVGEMDMLIETARAMLWKAAAEADIEEPQTWARKSVASKWQWCQMLRSGAECRVPSIPQVA